MIITPHTLNRAISYPGVGFRPAAVRGLILLHGDQVIDKLICHPSAQTMLDDPAIGMKLSGAMHGVGDLMRDTFGGGDQCIGVQFGRWWLVGARWEEYLLVALCPGGGYPWTVETWLQQLRQALASGVA